MKCHRNSINKNRKNPIYDFSFDSAHFASLINFSQLFKWGGGRGLLYILSWEKSIHSNSLRWSEGQRLAYERSAATNHTCEREWRHNAATNRKRERAWRHSAATNDSVPCYRKTLRLHYMGWPTHLFQALTTPYPWYPCLITDCNGASTITSIYIYICVCLFSKI